jgi:Sulfotransferase domain
MAKIELTSSLISKLKHIDTSALKPGVYEFPDFMILGPQRTGTTWLQRYLIQHPDIFMPHLKELYFFNYLITKNTKGVNYKTNRLEWYSSQFELTWLKFIQKNWSLLKSFKSFKKLDYDLSGFLKPVVKGEATASYAVMEASLVNEVVLLNPSIKVIISVRNPIDRAWSHASKDLITNKRPLKSIPFQEFENFYMDDYMIKCGKYSEIIHNWRAALPTDQISISMFKDIAKKPVKALEQSLNFLGVDPGKLLEKLKDDTIHKIGGESRHVVPEQHAQFLRTMFASDMKKTEELLGQSFD